MANIFRIDRSANTIQLGTTGTITSIGFKHTAGSFSSPIDVTNTRQYGIELHYSGNNYNATAIRARAHAVTTDTSAQFQGGLFQAANNDNINVGVLNGLVAEAMGKATANAATITMMRGALVGAEWSAKDTVTDLRTLHVRTHTRDAATEGYVSGTGYGIYIENEAVGGNGQVLDAGIYFKGTNLSAGNKAFTYGIDFSGATYGTADIKLSDGSVINKGGKWGIGTSIPLTTLEVVGTTTVPLSGTRYINSVGSGGYIGRKARGTFSSPTQVLLDDGIASFSARGYHSGGAFSNAVGIAGFFASENFTSTNQGTYYAIYTTTIGNISPTERLRITSPGNVGINTTSPDTKLQVVGDCKFGDDNTNYTALASDGLQTMIGTARVIKTVELVAGAISLHGANVPTLTDLGIGKVLRFGDEAVNYDVATARIQLPKDMDKSVQPKVVICWGSATAASDSTKQCRWQVAYLPRALNESFAAAAETTVTDNYNPSTTVNGCVMTEVQLANVGSSDICIIFQIARRSDDGGDTLGDNADLQAIHLQYTSNKLGTAT